MNSALQNAQKRQHRAKAASLLMSLYEQGELDDPGFWSWDVVDRLPAWCLLGIDDRQHLQRVCGALYLSPEIRFWIGKPLLLALRYQLGEPILSRILAHADDMQLPREPLRLQIPNVSSVIKPDQLEPVLLAAGATVLTATVHESLPRDMLLGSIGQSIGEISHDAASVLHEVACAFVSQSSETPARVA